jgi:hypothetical protein
MTLGRSSFGDPELTPATLCGWWELAGRCRALAMHGMRSTVYLARPRGSLTCQASTAAHDWIDEHGHLLTEVQLAYETAESIDDSID